MNHPSSEDWMSYLYGELTPDRHAELDQHLAHCPACATRVESWNATRRDLDTWQIEEPARKVSRRFPVVVQWAAAACVLLGVGLLIGRQLAPHVDEAALEARLAAKLESRVQAETARVQQNYAAQLEKDRQAMLETVQKIETQRASDYATLRTQLENVASLAEDGLTTAHQRLVQIAATQSGGTDSRTQ